MTLNESEILFPHKTITFNGTDVTVHEFKYLEGLKAAGVAQPLLTGLLELIDTEPKLSMPGLDRVIGDNVEVWLKLLSMSSDKPVEWIENLNDADGTLLSMTFWELNGPFLLRRVTVAKQFGTIALKPPVVS